MIAGSSVLPRQTFGLPAFGWQIDFYDLLNKIKKTNLNFNIITLFLFERTMLVILYMWNNKHWVNPLRNQLIDVLGKQNCVNLFLTWPNTKPAKTNLILSLCIYSWRAFSKYCLIKNWIFGDTVYDSFYFFGQVH